MVEEETAAENESHQLQKNRTIQGGEMKTRIWLTFAAMAIAVFVLIQCGTPATPAPPPAPVVQTVVVPQTVVNTVKETVPVPQTVVAQQTVVVEPTKAPPSGVVKVLLIGKPDEDSIDQVTGKPVPGVQQLKKMFEEKYPTIDMQIINIPWGSGATGYGPKTETMIQAQEACVYHMPGAFDYGRRGYLQNLDDFIKNDPDFKNVWGDNLAQWRGWGPGNPDNQWGLPYSGGNRVIHYDAKLFEDWGVEPLSLHPTLQEIEEKAAKMTGKNPKTGEQNYGYWYQGKYINWQFQVIAHAFGATWGKVNDDGTWTINWNTPEYLKALEWLVKMSKYAPPGALAADAMPDGFLTDQNVVAIIPEGETGYYLQPFVSTPGLDKRFRTVYNIQGPDGKGGLFIADPITMAASCPNKDAAWVVMKWLAGSVESQKYNFDSGGNLPVIDAKLTMEAIPELGKLTDAQAILDQNAHAEKRYPWASSQPRFSLQTAIEAALAGTLTPQQALEQAQKETDDWLKQQQQASQ
jgi:multiple sugar transport system substrate-binding protein